MDNGYQRSNHTVVTVPETVTNNPAAEGSPTTVPGSPSRRVRRPKVQRNPSTKLGKLAQALFEHVNHCSTTSPPSAKWESAGCFKVLNKENFMADCPLAVYRPHGGGKEGEIAFSSLDHRLVGNGFIRIDKRVRNKGQPKQPSYYHDILKELQIGSESIPPSQQSFTSTQVDQEIDDVDMTREEAAPDDPQEPSTNEEQIKMLLDENKDLKERMIALEGKVRVLEGKCEATAAQESRTHQSVESLWQKCALYDTFVHQSFSVWSWFNSFNPMGNPNPGAQVQGVTTHAVNPVAVSPRNNAAPLQEVGPTGSAAGGPNHPASVAFVPLPQGHGIPRT